MRNKDKFLKHLAQLWRISGIAWQITLPEELLIGVTPHNLYSQQPVSSTKHFMHQAQIFPQDASAQSTEQFTPLAESYSRNTSQKQTLAEIRDLLLEREQIAREMHDTIAQQIFAISMQVATALALLEQPCEARQPLEEAIEILRTIQQHLLTTNREPSAM